jgi:hypothetical protein
VDVDKKLERFLKCRLAEETSLIDVNPLRIRPSLTLSRQAGARANTIGKRLVQYLDQFDETADHGWAVVDQRLVAKVIEDHKLPDSVAQYLPEDVRNPVSDTLEEILGLHPSSWTLFHYTVQTIRKLCALGNVIVVGRGGNLVTGDFPNTFHVRLVGAVENRVRQAREGYGMNAAEARNWVKETDHARARYVKRHLDSDIDDPVGYHLVINTDRISDSLAARIIGDSLLEWVAAGDSAQIFHPKTASK